LFGELVELDRRELVAGTVHQEQRKKLASQLNGLYRDTFEGYLDYRSQRRR
jgi:hypothetical protein